MSHEVTPAALKQIVADRLGHRKPALFLDYDGTLTPIVERPELAQLDEDMRSILRTVAFNHPVFIVSGRDREDVYSLVGVDQITYVGSHGFHMMGDAPGIDTTAVDAALPQLKSAADELEVRLATIEGVLIERKQFSFAVHFRLVEPGLQDRVKSEASAALRDRESITTKPGKMVVEFVPAIDWNKGKCLRALHSRLERESGGTRFYTIYLGDDVTDEDAFAVLSDNRGLGVLVAEYDRDTQAEFRLPDTEKVKQFLEGFIDA